SLLMRVRPGRPPPRVEGGPSGERPRRRRFMSLRSIIARRSFAAALVALVVAVLANAPALSQAPQDEAKAKSKAKAKAKPDAPPSRPRTYANVPYGAHPREVLDFYKAESAEPTPLVVYIHGGGWNAGDKGRVAVVDVKRLLKEGISVAAINYRLVPQAFEA